MQTQDTNSGQLGGDRAAPGFSIRRVDLEPPAEGAAAPVQVRCPTCGNMVVVTECWAETEQLVSRVPPAGDLPDPAAVRDQVRHVLALLLEVFDGRRPPAQLAGLLSPAALRYLRAVAAVHQARRVSRLLSVRICRPADRVAETAAVVTVNGRPRALAARFEHEGEVWRCVVVRLL